MFLCALFAPQLSSYTCTKLQFRSQTIARSFISKTTQSYSIFSFILLSFLRRPKLVLYSYDILYNVQVSGFVFRRGSFGVPEHCVAGWLVSTKAVLRRPVRTQHSGAPRDLPRVQILLGATPSPTPASSAPLPPDDCQILPALVPSPQTRCVSEPEAILISG